MANQLIPSPELAPTIPDHLTVQQRFALWADLLDTGEALLLAGLRRQIGPDGDLREAYRRWNEQRIEERERAKRQMAENMYRRGVRHGR